MTLPHVTPRRVVPYLLSGASGVHILARMWRLSRLPAANAPLHVFLLRHADVILVLGSGPVVWRLARREHQDVSRSSHLVNHPNQSLIPYIAHQLRQVFTALLLGLGLIKRKATAQQSTDITGLANRLQNLVGEGIRAVNVLDPPTTVAENGRERALGE
jgi:hypothetical protein